MVSRVLFSTISFFFLLGLVTSLEQYYSQIILCAICIFLGHFILLSVIQFQYHQAFSHMVSDMFLFVFISFDRSSNFQHFILRNIEGELFLFKSSVLLLVVRSHQRYPSICTVRNTLFSAFFFLRS